jgi:hypothetical protein
MSLCRAAVFALVAALVAPQAFAQDDLFVPIPTKEGGKSKPKAGKRRTPKKSATAKKPPPAPAPGAAEDDLIVPMPAKKPATAKTPAPASQEDDLIVPMPAKKPATAKKPPPATAEDDLVVPIKSGRSELLVKMTGGVKGARLFVDNKEVGTLPLSAPLPMEAGEHTLVVRRPGFADFSRRITVQEGKPTEVSVALEAVSGVVAVTSDVPGASVTINGQPRGQAPLNGLLLKPGTYEIIVSLEGYKPETKSLSVRAGRDYTVAANLRPAEGSPPVAVAGTDRPEKPVLTPSTPAASENPTIPVKPEEEPVASASQPWFKRWYVWAGVGAVVTAATVGTVMATQGGSAKPLSPDEVCGGVGCDGTINGPASIMRPAGVRF